MFVISVCVVGRSWQEEEGQEEQDGHDDGRCGDGHVRHRRYGHEDDDGRRGDDRRQGAGDRQDSVAAGLDHSVEEVVGRWRRWRRRHVRARLEQLGRRFRVGRLPPELRSADRRCGRTGNVGRERRHGVQGSDGRQRLHAAVAGFVAVKCRRGRYRVGKLGSAKTVHFGRSELVLFPGNISFVIAPLQSTLRPDGRKRTRFSLILSLLYCPLGGRSPEHRRQIMVRQNSFAGIPFDAKLVVIVHIAWY